MLEQTNTTSTLLRWSSVNVTSLTECRQRPKTPQSAPWGTSKPAINPPVVDPDIAGRAVARSDLDLKRSLGAPAWAVWLFLLQRRDVRGCTTRNNDEIAVHCWIETEDEKKRISHRQVRSACQRLKAAGLLYRARSWAAGAFSSDPRGRQAWVVERAVLGDFRNGVVSLPVDVIGRVRALPQRGGRRAGAGRPRSIPYIIPGPNEDIFGMPINEDGARILPIQSRHHSNSNPAGRRRSETEGSISESLSEILQCTPSGEDASEVRKIASLQESEPERNGAPPSSTERVFALFEVDEKGGARFGGKFPPRMNEDGTPNRTLSAAGARKVAELKKLEEEIYARIRNSVMPPFPSNKEIGVVPLPNPPLLDDKLTELQTVERLVRTYNGAVESRYPKLGRSFILCNTDLKKSKYWDVLKEAAQELRDFEIAPAAWVPFAIDVWVSYNKKGGRNRPPPITFVFAARFIRERQSWFRHESGYSGGRVTMSAIHKECIERFHAVDRQLLRTPLIPGRTAEECMAPVIERWFPGGWRAWYDKAKAEAADARTRVERMVRDGEFVW